MVKAMTTTKIKNIDLYKLSDITDHIVYYGSNQDWYDRPWQRMSGCAPSTVANIIYYIHCSGMEPERRKGLTKEECLLLMREMWNYVTPSLGGVRTTAMLRNGTERYLKAKKAELKLEVLDIPRARAERPEEDKVTGFIVAALEADCPVAFLNLERGKLTNLESWHWVTIISLTFDGQGQILAEILDSGIRKEIDLGLWLRTTRLGGGFVSFLKSPESRNTK